MDNKQVVDTPRTHRSLDARNGLKSYKLSEGGIYQCAEDVASLGGGENDIFPRLRLCRVDGCRRVAEK